MAKSKKRRLKEKAVKIATEQMLAEYPNCLLCPNKADTCHHFIRQSQSNYLRCDKRNLIPICQKCHYLWHHGGKAEVMTLRLVQRFGDEWRDGLIKDSTVRIKDTVGYWEGVLSSLSSQPPR